MNELFVLETGTSCIEWIVAIALVAVGGTVVRKAEPRAGMLAMATGVIWLLQSCCQYTPALYTRFAGHSDSVSTLYSIIPWFNILFTAGGVAGLLGAAVVLTRAIQALPPSGGAR